MVEQLFGSKTRVKLLQLFFSNPNRSFFVREITRKIEEQINSVRRELANLLSAGIISSETTNNKLFYEVNQKYEFYKPLSEIFGKNKQKVVADKVAVADVNQAVKAIGNIDLVIFTGQFTRDDNSSVDILIVGDANPTQVSKYITDLESQESKELRYTVMTASEFAYRKQVKDRFLSLVLSSKKQIVLDKHNLLATKVAEKKEESKKPQNKE